MDKSYDAVSKRECCVCFADLHLSAVQCSCSVDRYSCLSHMRKLCACPCDKKSFLYRYTIDELNILVEALMDSKLSVMFRWGNIDRTYSASLVAMTSSQSEDKEKKTDEVTPGDITRKDFAGGSKDQTKVRVKARSMVDILNVKEGNDDEKGTVKACSKKSTRPCNSSAVNTAKKQKQ